MSEAAEAFPEELPLDEIQADIERCVGLLKGHPRHCGRNAFQHLRKAWRLYGLDNEMSLLRAITAEEEAATALILALKARRYPGADRLDHRRHDHKAGVAPFLYAVGPVLSVWEFARPRIHLSWADNRPRLNVSVSALAAGVSSDPDQLLQPDEPFNFIAREGSHDGPGEVMTFANQLAELASGKGAGEILDFIREEANLRNRLLYAKSDGIPSATFNRSLLLAKLRRVCLMLQVTIGILQTPAHQLFAVQCLEAYLGALRRLPETGFDFDIEEPKGDHNRILVTKLDDAPPVAEAEIVRQVRLDRIVVSGPDIDIHMTGVNDGAAYAVNLRGTVEDRKPREG